eukprot:1140989-Pelagomonas_calceolata.AAC.9
MEQAFQREIANSWEILDPTRQRADVPGWYRSCLTEQECETELCGQTIAKAAKSVQQNLSA